MGVESLQPGTTSLAAPRITAARRRGECGLLPTELGKSLAALDPAPLGASQSASPRREPMAFNGFLIDVQLNGFRKLGRRHSEIDAIMLVEGLTITTKVILHDYWKVARVVPLSSFISFLRIRTHTHTHTYIIICVYIYLYIYIHICVYAMGLSIHDGTY